MILLQNNIYDDSDFRRQQGKMMAQEEKTVPNARV
jgi:hypothetical protein